MTKKTNAAKDTYSESGNYILSFNLKLIVALRGSTKATPLKLIFSFSPLDFPSSYQFCR